MFNIRWLKSLVKASLKNYQLGVSDQQNIGQERQGFISFTKAVEFYCDTKDHITPDNPTPRSAVAILQIMNKSCTRY